MDADGPLHVLALQFILLFTQIAAELYDYFTAA